MKNMDREATAPCRQEVILETVANALDALAQTEDARQWLLIADEGPVTCCGGPGPFRPGDIPETLSGKRAEPCRGGWLAASTPEAGAQWGYVLACWVPESHGAPTPALWNLIATQCALLEHLFRLSSHEHTLSAELDAARREASHDILTGLYNRRGWGALVEKEEARSRRYGNACTLVVVDLDELKAINDSQGHRAGDRLIRHAARVISSTTRQPDVVARVGGDEFAVLLVETDKARAAGFMSRLTAALDEAQIHASVGSAQWCPEESLCDTLYRADQAMYADKRIRQRERAG